MPSFLDRVLELERKVAELDRRARNRKRTGTISEVDTAKGLARVKIADGAQGPYLSPWVPWKEVASGGIKSHIPPTVGEQVDIVSESGDLADGVIDMSTPSNANPRPHDGSEAVITKGDSRIMLGDGVVRITSATIILEGDVHLGGEGGNLVHRKGDLDSDGDAAVGSAAKVYAL